VRFAFVLTGADEPVSDRVIDAADGRLFRRRGRMKNPYRNLFIVGLVALSLAACSTTGERIGGAGVGVVTGGAIAGPVGAVAGGIGGAIVGPRVSNAMGVPHRGRRHRRHYQHYS
jgi:osmotically inducible lipoprotein OsmB